MKIKQIAQWVESMTDRELLTAWHKYCAPSESPETPSEQETTIAYVVNDEINKRGL
jgi:hypothetical protein